MANVPAQINSEIPTNGARSASQRVSLAKDATTSLDGVLSGEHQAHDGAAGHEGDEAGEEGFGGKVGVMLFEVGFAGRGELGGEELVAALLETGDNLANLHKRDG